MNEHEELLAKALACLSEVAKIQDPGVRAKVLALAYHSQQVAQAAILRAINDRPSGREPSKERPADRWLLSNRYLGPIQKLAFGVLGVCKPRIPLASVAPSES
jgi:hypothetical protein